MVIVDGACDAFALDLALVMVVASDDDGVVHRYVHLAAAVAEGAGEQSLAVARHG